MSDLFTITLETGGKSFVGKGETALKALQAIKPPQKLMLKGIITTQHGDIKTKRLLAPVRLRRFFYPNAQRILIKQLTMGMK